MNIYRRVRRQRTNVNYRKIWVEANGPIPMDATGRSYDIHHVDGNHHNNKPSNLVAVPIDEHFAIHHEQGEWAACLLIAQRMNMPTAVLSELARKHQLERSRSGRHPWLRRADGSSVRSDELKRRIEQGIHPWQKREDGSSLTGDRTKQGLNPLSKRSDGSSVTSDRTKQGLNPLSKRSDGSSVTSDRTKLGLNPFSRRSDGSSVASDKVKSNTHNWQRDDTGESFSSKRVAEGSHHLLKRADGSSVATDSIEKGIHPKFIKVSCVYCRKESSLTNFCRWHGDNCKHKT